MKSFEKFKCFCSWNIPVLCRTDSSLYRHCTVCTARNVFQMCSDAANISTELKKSTKRVVHFFFYNKHLIAVKLLTIQCRTECASLEIKNYLHNDAFLLKQMARFCWLELFMRFRTAEYVLIHTEQFIWYSHHSLMRFFVCLFNRTLLLYSRSSIERKNNF